MLLYDNISVAIKTHSVGALQAVMGRALFSKYYFCMKIKHIILSCIFEIYFESILPITDFKPVL